MDDRRPGVTAADVRVSEAAGADAGTAVTAAPVLVYKGDMIDTAYRVSPLRPTDPERIGDYLLVGRLGVGGMGVVYLAEADDGTPVAIKLIHPDLATDPEFSGRFRSEVARSRRVPSFCAAEFLAADLDHDPPYLVVEYIDGPGLDEVVAERGPLRSGALHSLAVGVATALTGIHGAGIIHRDLKPDNVLLPPGSPKVIDFGIARPFEATSRHTRPDVMVGTVPYMAPERFSDRQATPVTAAVDVFAWGCVITFAGTGRTPFEADSTSATAARILTQPPNLDGLPETLLEPVRRALAKDPADRPTAPELLAMLLGSPPAAPAGPRPPVDPQPPAGLRPPADPQAPAEPAPPADPQPAADPRTAVIARSVVGPQPAGAPETGADRQPTDSPQAAADPPPTVPPGRPVRSVLRRRRAVLSGLAVLPLLAGVTVAALLSDGDGGDRRTGSTDPSPAAPPTSSIASATTPSAPRPAAPTAAPATPDRSGATSGQQAESTTAPGERAEPTDGPTARAAANPSGRNIALGRPATASSQEGNHMAAADAVDGDPDTRWSSEFADPQWLTVDLGGLWQVSEVVLRWQRSYATGYRVDVSPDGQRWTTVYRTSTGEGGVERVTVDQVPGRYVRMYATQRAGQYGYSLWEMEVR
ncbi:protein kinase domain-containing protein [Micromonospora cathayae]|uniref:Discoidin domain-containing protein n=1 Tax=Micromonospora cathayae TaxID=3028804 RepID=A0ABY7ZLV3_9ACTN|nr:discoidin domain-containing protein [Micromonospora sp. HUAS 3]WDZ83731.1 discoidin domain-containing protein [Micromonospora sp. HUAS 3]